MVSDTLSSSPEADATIPDFEDDTGSASLCYAAVTDIGSTRPHNEDSCAALLREDDQTVLLVVADGMGGYQGGDVASATAAQNIQQAFLDHGLENTLDFTRVYAQIDRDIQTRLQGAKGGTTCVVALVDGATLTIANIGDSRAYLYRNGSLEQLTKDDSLVQMLLDSGRITEAQAHNYPKRNVIMKALGVGKEIDPRMSGSTLHAGDLVLLCTDGLCGTLSDAELIQAIAEEGELTDAEALNQLCRKLISKAIAAGSTDNITAACCRRIY